MKHSTVVQKLSTIVLMITSAPALAQDATGVWLVEERDAEVRIGPCGDALCGWISRLKVSSGVAKMGQRVLWDMKSDGGGMWIGKAFNPRDGNTYSGRMKVSGDALKMTGCVLAGLLCKTASWVRVR